MHTTINASTGTLSFFCVAVSLTFGRRNKGLKTRNGSFFGSESSAEYLRTKKQMHNHSTTMDDTHDSLVSNLERALWGNDTNVVPPSLSASSQQPPQTSSTTAATTATVTRVEPPSNNVISYCVHALVGALIGLVLVSFTSLALIEITFSPVFSVLLGLLFDALAVCLFYRSFSVPVCL